MPVANLSPDAQPAPGPLARLKDNLDAPLSKRDFLRGRFSGAIVTIEGELVVRLAWDGRRVRGVRIRSTRPFAAARVLGGKTGAEAAAMVPLLFSICGRAQGAAAAARDRSGGGHRGRVRRNRRARVAGHAGDDRRNTCGAS